MKALTARWRKAHVRGVWAVAISAFLAVVGSSATANAAPAEFQYHTVQLSQAGRVALNLTAVRPSVNGYLNIRDCNGPETFTSAVNFTAGQTTAGLATIKTMGCVTVQSPADVNVVVDVVGWLSTDAPANLNGQIPVRMLDTREQNVPMTVGGPRYSFALTQSSQVVIAAVNPGGPGYLTVFSCAVEPTTSTLNFSTGQTVSNAIMLEAGQWCVAAVGPVAGTKVDLVVDRYEPVAVTNVGKRLLDSRVGGTTMRTYQLTVKPDETVALNVVAVNPLSDGYISVQQCRMPPTTSSLNYTTGRTRANLAVIKAASDGKVCITASATTDVVVDQVGTLTSWTPDARRVYDSRR